MACGQAWRCNTPLPILPPQGEKGRILRVNAPMLPSETHHPSRLTFNSSIAGIPSAPSA